MTSVYGRTPKGPDYVEEDRGYDTPCWTWQKAKSEGGYGLSNFANGRRGMAAHRAYYIEHVGPIPDGLHLDHLCRNRDCVNPAHVEPVTQAENNRRAGKLSPEDVAVIRASSETNVALARRYEVSDGHISDIRSGKKWAIETSETALEMAPETPRSTPSMFDHDQDYGEAA